MAGRSHTRPWQKGASKVRAAQRPPLAPIQDVEGEKPETHQVRCVHLGCACWALPAPFSPSLPFLPFVPLALPPPSLSPCRAPRTRSRSEIQSPRGPPRARSQDISTRHCSSRASSTRHHLRAFARAAPAARLSWSAPPPSGLGSRGPPPGGSGRPAALTPGCLPSPSGGSLPVLPVSLPCLPLLPDPAPGGAGSSHPLRNLRSGNSCCLRAPAKALLRKERMEE